MQVITKYVRLLTYDDALKVIDWVMKSNKDNYAYITPGGIGVQLTVEEDFKNLENFIKGLTDNYEICDEHPQKVEKRIIEELKESNVI